MDTFREEEAKEFHDAIGEAFADEWGFSPLPFEEWWACARTTTRASGSSSGTEIESSRMRVARPAGTAAASSG